MLSDNKDPKRAQLEYLVWTCAEHESEKHKLTENREMYLELNGNEPVWIYDIPTPDSYH